MGAEYLYNTITKSISTTLNNLKEKPPQKKDKTEEPIIIFRENIKKLHSKRAVLLKVKNRAQQDKLKPILVSKAIIIKIRERDLTVKKQIIKQTTENNNNILKTGKRINPKYSANYLFYKRNRATSSGQKEN